MNTIKKVEDGYWKNKENIIKYARGLIEKHKILPNTVQLVECGESSFCAAVYHYFPDGLKGLKEYLGIPLLIKPAGFWTKKVILTKLKQVSQKNDGFILHSSEMTKNGDGDIISAIQRKFGSYNDFCEKNGLSFKKVYKPYRYWNNIDNIINELNEIINYKNMGYFPTWSVLMMLKKFSLYRAIVKNGGLHVLRAKMGFPDNRPTSKDGNILDSMQEVFVYNQLLDSDDLEFEYGIEIILDNKKVIPDFVITNYSLGRKKYLIEVLMANPKDPGNSVQRKYLEHYALKKELYLRHKDTYVLFEIIPDDFFNNETLKAKLDSIIDAIKNGIHLISPIALDNTKSKRGNGYWYEFKNIKDEYTELIIKLKRFPKSKDLPGYLKKAIKHHGGHRKVAKKLGWDNYGILKRHPKPPFYWTVKENILRELSIICNDIGDFPSDSELKHLNRQDIIGAIYKHYDKYKLAEKLGYKIKGKRRRTRNYWNHDSMLKELKPICLELNGIPTEGELRKMGLGDLSHFNKYITRVQLADILNLPLIIFRSPNGYWKNWENIKSELDEIYDQICGRRPHKKDFLNLNRYDVLRGIQRYHGSMSEILDRYEEEK